MEIELRKCALNSQPLTVKKSYLSMPESDQADHWKVLLLWPDAVASAVLYDAMAQGPAAFAAVTVDGERVSGAVTVRRVLHGQNAELRGIGLLNGAGAMLPISHRV